MTADDSCIVSQVFNACPTHRALPCSRNGAEQHCGDFVCQVCDRVIAGCPCKVNLSNSNWADKDLQSRQLTYPATFSQFSRRSSDGQSKVAVGWLDWATSLQPHPMALQLGPAMTLPLSSTSTACISSKVTGYDWIHSNFFSIIQWRNHSTVLERLSLDLLAQVSSCSHPTPRQITLVCPLCSKKQSLRMFPPLLQESVCWFSMLFSATKLLVFDGFSANLQEFEKKKHTYFQERAKNQGWPSLYHKFLKRVAEMYQRPNFAVHLPKLSPSLQDRPVAVAGWVAHKQIQTDFRSISVYHSIFFGYNMLQLIFLSIALQSWLFCLFGPKSTKPKIRGFKFRCSCFRDFFPWSSNVVAGHRPKMFGFPLHDLFECKFSTQTKKSKKLSQTRCQKKNEQPRITNGSLPIRSVEGHQAVIASSWKGMSLTGAENATKSNNISWRHRTGEIGMEIWTRNVGKLIGIGSFKNHVQLVCTAAHTKKILGVFISLPPSCYVATCGSGHGLSVYLVFCGHEKTIWIEISNVGCQPKFYKSVSNVSIFSVFRIWIPISFFDVRFSMTHVFWLSTYDFRLLVLSYWFSMRGFGTFQLSRVYFLSFTSHFGFEIVHAPISISGL